MWVRQRFRVSVYITWAFSVLGSHSFYSAEHRFLLSRNTALFSIVFSSDDSLGCSCNIVTISSLQLTFLVFVGRKRRHRPVAVQCLTLLVLPALYVVRHDVSKLPFWRYCVRLEPFICILFELHWRAHWLLPTLPRPHFECLPRRRYLEYGKSVSFPCPAPL